LTTLHEVLNKAFKDVKFWELLVKDLEKALASSNFELAQADLDYLNDRLNDSDKVARFEKFRIDSGAAAGHLEKPKKGRTFSAVQQGATISDSGEEPKVPWA
jgi:hypothetical protein